MIDEFKEQLQQMPAQAQSLFAQASGLSELQQAKARFLGKKGSLTALMKEMGKLPPEDKPAFGALANQVKDEIEQAVEERRQQLERQQLEQRLQQEQVDVSLPGRRQSAGSFHPISLVVRDLLRIFGALGFEEAQGPEIEKDFYNFEALNIPPDHPARDMQDTFYIDGDRVLRTHTSPVQIRTMENQAPPLRIVAPGTVYRRDSDLTHSPMFHQLEGFWVDEGVTFADLKGVLTSFVQGYFGADIGVRFRPSFFPFTEPSAEVDIACVICRGAGCRVCKHTGWLEILGAGMIDPEVFKAVGYDSNRYSGFAFGMGLERLAMLRYGVDDLRLFFANDKGFLQQFQGA